MVFLNIYILFELAKRLSLFNLTLLKLTGIQILEAAYHYHGLTHQICFFFAG